MNETIRKRKSVRKYDMTKLDSTTIEKIREKIDNLTPLFPDIRYSIEITDKTKGLFNVPAPHYLVFGSEEKDGAYENIGFIGQQLDLFFAENGLGCCWLGASKPQVEPERNRGAEGEFCEAKLLKKRQAHCRMLYVCHSGSQQSHCIVSCPSLSVRHYLK